MRLMESDVYLQTKEPNHFVTSVHFYLVFYKTQKILPQRNSADKYKLQVNALFHIIEQRERGPRGGGRRERRGGHSDTNLRTANAKLMLISCSEEKVQK